MVVSVVAWNECPLIGARRGSVPLLQYHYEVYRLSELANFESSNQIAERVNSYFPYCHQPW